MAFAEGRCKRSCVWMWLSFLLLSHAMAYPTSTSVPDVTPSSPRAVSCDWATQLCWAQGQLASASVGCAEPLARGACSAGEWWVLDLERPLLRGRCAPRPCPLGQLPWGGRCLAEDEARVALCGGRALYLDPAGVPRCGDFPGWTAALAAVARCEELTTQFLPEGDPTTTQLPLEEDLTMAIAVGGWDCAQYDNGDCVDDVEGPTPGAVIMAEDS